MERSANEVMTLATKAARGAGAPPEQAALFGRAVVCHLVAQRDAGAIRSALEALPGGIVMDLPLLFARLINRGTAEQAEGVVPLDDLAELTLSYIEAQPHETRYTHKAQGAHVIIQMQVPAQRRPVARVAMAADLGDWLETLAARTYVPESDASRLAGAGAGLTDND